ncbi:MAG: hypothetical protein ACR2GA_06635, partial [Chloroflexota bacterium]
MKLRSGITAHLLDFGVSIGSLDLWWEQSDSFVTVSGPRLSKDELVRIARSMSPTAVPKGSCLRGWHLRLASLTCSFTGQWAAPTLWTKSLV